MRYEDCLRVLQDHETYSSAQGPGSERLVPPDGVGMLIYADEPHHRRQRRIVQQALSPRMIAGMSAEMKRVASGLIEAMLPAGEAELVSQFANPFPMTIIAAMLGVPMADRDHFRRWTEDTMNAFSGKPELYERSYHSLIELTAYFLEEITRRRRFVAQGGQPPDDLLSALIFSAYEQRQFTDDELVMAVHTLLVAGNETTTNSICNAIHTLCTHPEQRARLREDWTLLDNAVEECLRYVSPAQGLFRTANHDVRIGDCSVPADAKVRVMYASANRDNAVIPAAEDFRVDRDPREVRRHLAFGHGIHSCVGAALAREELRIAIRLLLDKLPNLELDSTRVSQRLDSFLAAGWDSLYVRWAT
jgi:hypothetical protein